MKCPKCGFHGISKHWIYIRKNSEDEYYAWHTRQDKSLQSYTGPIDGLMKIVSELRRGIGQAKNKVKAC